MDEIQQELAERAGRLFSGRVEFLKSAPALKFLPDPDCPEIAFCGRSNVGKSSLLNALTGRRSIARASVTPGRTQELNFFEVGEPTQFRLVDMPGYGFAKAPPKVVEKCSTCRLSSGQWLLASARPSSMRCGPQA